MSKPPSRTPSIQSLDRGLVLLEMVARSTEPVALGQLTEHLGIDRSSVFRLATTLKRRGFLANPRGRKDYILGPSIWRLSKNNDWSKRLITFSRELLRSLAVRTGETTHLAVREGRQAFFVDHYAPARQVIQISGQTGEFVPLYCTAHGKALLADCSIADLKATFGNVDLHPYTERTVVSLRQLAKECARIRAAGFAYDDEEYVEGVRCLAAQVRDHDGTIVASIGISAPLARFPRERVPVAARHVCQIAEEIGIILGRPAEG